jgi:outer membrane protein insertion porin family
MLLGSICLLAGCLPMRHLQKNEYLLVDQYTVGNKAISNEELEPYYLQQPNRGLLGLPLSLWIYELGYLFFDRQAAERDYNRIKRLYNRKLAATKDPAARRKLEKEKQKRLSFYEDKLKNGNFLMQRGEPPVVYDKQKRIATEKNFLQYLHAKGYFDAKVKSKDKTAQGKTKVLYFIKENQPFLLRQITLNCPDTAIEQHLQPYPETSLLQKGQRYDQDILIAERERIYNTLLEQGYFGFNKQYISFNVDTTSHQAILETTIALPSTSSPHAVYMLDSIEFSILPRPDEVFADSTALEGGILFRNTTPYFAPSTIIDKITLQPGQPYTKSRVLEAQKRLASLGIFQEVHISQAPIEEKYLQTKIETKLYDKFQIEQEIGTEFTRISTLPFYQVALKSRNLLRKLETLSLKSQISIEVGALPTDGQKPQLLQKFQVGLGGSVQQFLLPLPRQWHQSLSNYYPHTQADVGYHFTNQPNYNSRRFAILLRYGWTPWPTVTFDFTPIGMNVVVFHVKEGFAQELTSRKERGDLTYKRYQPAFYNQMILKTVFRKITDATSAARRNVSLVEHLLEASNSLQNLIPLKKIFGTHFVYYQYLKTSIAFTRHRTIRAGTVLAYHLHTGVLYPYNQHKVAPPEQYYFIGGPNSIRAWAPRGLGPGSYRSPHAKDVPFKDERPGEFILQVNMELRQHLIGVLESAFFIDIGNVWMLQKAQRRGEDFAFNRFYKEVAIGTGAGLALNFDFIVLRLDIGFKLYDPAMPMGMRLFPPNLLSPTINFNLGNPF